MRSRPRGEKRRPREKLTLLGGIMVCAEHGVPIVGASRDGLAAYSANSPGLCYATIQRALVNQLVTTTVIARPQRPDARQLFELSPADSNEEERQVLLQRRDEIARLFGDGHLSAAAARSELERLADQIANLAPVPAPVTAARELLHEPEEEWVDMTQVQRRQVLQVLFSSITLAHAGYRYGPRVDIRRVQLSWR